MNDQVSPAVVGRSDSGQETPEDFMTLGRLDWYVTQNWNRLHYVEPADFTPEHFADMADGWAVFTPVRLACGRMAKNLHIPGIFSRMSKLRCAGCCRATGMPAGAGSPKNDDECRKLLGLDRKRTQEEMANESG
jgi:hypothetical protein